MNAPLPNLRRLGETDIEVSPVALGCWPIAGMTSLDVTRENSLATLTAAFDAGVNFYDTAYCYGPDGESERLIAEALGAHRDKIVIATKAGIAWHADGSRRLDARPTTIQAQLDASLQRLNTDCVDLFYLHAPDPNVPITETAGAFAEALQRGKARAIGASNVNLEQLIAFREVCSVACIQPPYNMLQRRLEREILPYCRQHQIATCVYWPLMKGLLAGKLPRDHQFDPKDGRAKYPMFQGDEWHKNQDFIDQLRPIAQRLDRTVADIVINWTIHQPGITSALCGAKRPDQIQETATAMHWRLSESDLALIDQALAERGEPVVRGAV